jgi:hypothetical protein
MLQLILESCFSALEAVKLLTGRAIGPWLQFCHIERFDYTLLTPA